MSTSTSTPTRPTKEIDLHESQIVINKAHQLPLHVLAFRDSFTAATQDIARIAENANPEDPGLLNVEITAIKVRHAAHSGFVCSKVLVGFERHVGGTRWACSDAHRVRWEKYRCLPRSFLYAMVGYPRQSDHGNPR